MKRVFDIVAGVVLAVVLAPIFLLCLLGALVFQGRPIFFSQQRVGRGGDLFPIYKFRTMRPAKQEDGFDAGNSSRITPLGALLRKTKMDELPQLLNVLRGEMSLVGPRPEVPKWVAVYPERWARVLSVRPGVTDPASVRFRNEEVLLAQAEDPEQEYRNHVLPTKLSLYEEYVDNHSFLGDLLIIVKTMVSLFKTS